MYCLTAAWVVGMSSSVLPLCAKSCFLASFISIVSLVLSHMSTTHLSSHDIDSSLTAEGSRSSSMNASVTSRNALHVCPYRLLSSTREGHRVTSCEGMEDEKNVAVPKIHFGHQLMDRYVSKM